MSSLGTTADLERDGRPSQGPAGGWKCHKQAPLIEQKVGDVVYENQDSSCELVKLGKCKTSFFKKKDPKCVDEQCSDYFRIKQSKHGTDEKAKTSRVLGKDVEKARLSTVTDAACRPDAAAPPCRLARSYASPTRKRSWA